MGIDCGDVREVVHVDAPDDVESYIQERLCMWVHQMMWSLIFKRGCACGCTR